MCSGSLISGHNFLLVPMKKKTRNRQQVICGNEYGVVKYKSTAFLYSVGLFGKVVLSKDPFVAFLLPQ